MTGADPTSPSATCPANDAEALSSDGTIVKLFPLAGHVLRQKQPAATHTEAAGLLPAADVSTGAATPTTAGLTSSCTRTGSEKAGGDDWIAAQHSAGQTSDAITHTAAPQQPDTATTGIATVSSNSSPERAQHRSAAPLIDSGSDQRKQSEDDMLLSGEQSVKDNSSQPSTLLLCIEKALHLNLPNTLSRKQTAQNTEAEDSSAQASVRVAYKQAEQWASTTAVAVAPGGGAVWHHEVQLDISALNRSNQNTQELQVGVSPVTMLVTFCSCHKLA